VEKSPTDEWLGLSKFYNGLYSKAEQIRLSPVRVSSDGVAGGDSRNAVTALLKEGRCCLTQCSATGVPRPTGVPRN